MFPSIIAAPAGLCNCPGRGAARGAAAHRRDRRGQDRVGAADGSNPLHRFMQQAKPRVGAADIGGTAKPRHRRWTCAGAVLLDWSHSLIPVCFVGLFSPSCAFCRRMDRDSLRIFRFSVWFWCWQILSFRHIPETVLSKSFVSLFDPGGFRVRPGPRALGGPAACTDPCRNFRPALTIHSRFGAVLIWCTFPAVII